ncbi:MAG TPA: ABC transporter ATP-binding protein [Candidatus Babeliaceae bacterium]|nr:ABC transporter ATP-binding protein [Candidatus Babeliaceae bacterium]
MRIKSKPEVPTTMGNDTIITVTGLTKTFIKEKPWWKTAEPEAFTAVDNLSFTVGKGEILGILGANGAGKTTTMQMMLGTMIPTAGTITYFGKDFFTHRSQVLQHISFASTYIKMPGDLTVRQNLLIYGGLYGLSKQECEQASKYYLEAFGIAHVLNTEVRFLSAGQITRVMLAKSFLCKPAIVLLDEPTASLDPESTLDVRKFILKQRKDHNVTFLITSHDMEEVAALCDRVLVLKEGKLIASDTPTRLASSITQANVELILESGLEQLKQYAHEQGYLIAHLNHTVSLQVDEQSIAKLLRDLTLHGVVYSHISINKPTLEDYFLQVASPKYLKKG